MWKILIAILFDLFFVVTVKKIKKIIVHSNPKLFFALEDNTEIGIDGKFRAAPKPCYELFIIMVFGKKIRGTSFCVLYFIGR